MEVDALAELKREIGEEEARLGELIQRRDEGLEGVSDCISMHINLTPLGFHQVLSRLDASD
jgi:hypothetical protein